jgi:hypothetical protein
MTTTNRIPSFAKQISLDEYNKQKKDYTEKALLELQSQMATLKPNHTKLPSDSEDDSESSETAGGINVIIKNYNDTKKMGATGLRKRRKPSTSNDADTGTGADGLSSSIYVQRELELQELQKLKNKIEKLKSLLDEEQRKNHFLKLELCNAQVDNSDLKNNLSARDNKIKHLETKQIGDWWKIIKLQVFIGLLVLLYIYAFLF